MTSDPRWPAESDGVGIAARTSLLLEACALARGLSTVRVSSRMFIGGVQGETPAFGFYRTLSLETSRAAVRICNDRIMRSVVLRERGIRAPTLAKFGFDQVDEAVAYAESFPVGVLVKPRTRDVGRFRLKPTRSPRIIRRRIETLRESIGAAGTFIVEEWVDGHEYMFFIVGGRVQSVVRRESRAWTEEVFRSGPDGFGEFPPAILELAERAFEALPGMPHATVHIVAPDASGSIPDCAVVSIEPRVRLIGRRLPATWSVEMADRLIAHTSRSFLAPSENSTNQAKALSQVDNELGGPEDIERHGPVN